MTSFASVSKAVSSENELYNCGRQNVTITESKIKVKVKLS